MISVDTNTLMVLGLALAACGFFGGLAMNGVLEDDGFGVVGNMVILIAGALIGIYLGGFVRLPLDGMTAEAVRAVSGAFICLTALALLKNFLARLGL